MTTRNERQPAFEESGYSEDGRAPEATPQVASGAGRSAEAAEREPEVPGGPAHPHDDELEGPVEQEPREGPVEREPREGPVEREPLEEAVEREPREEVSEHEGKLERDLEELTAKAEKADEYLELAKRTKADFENYRKRAARDAAAAQERGVTKLARELLPAVDNLERALAAAERSSNGEDLLSGIRLVRDEVLAALGRVGIAPFSPQGERFDPEVHEAVAQRPVEGAEPGTVAEVYQCGYRMGSSVLRPARVLVAG